MSGAKPNPIVRLLPSMSDLAFVAPVLVLFGMCRRANYLLGDGDTGWHLRSGEWILAHGRVPVRDFFSYTRPGRPWFAWEWLWDTAFAGLYRLGGLPAVLLASLLVICLTSALLFRLVRRKCGNSVLAMALAALWSGGSAVHWLARPHLFTPLFVVIFYGLLDRVREAQQAGSPRAFRRLAWLPALTVLWTNLHGGFFVGITLVIAYAMGEAIAAALAPGADARRASLRHAGAFVLTAAGCALASLMNPYGWRLHQHLFAYLGDARVRAHISEFEPMGFSHPSGQFFEVLLLAGGAALLWSLSRRRYTEAVLLALWAHLGLMSARNVPLYLLVAAPIVGQAAAEWLARLPEVAASPWLRRLAGRAGRTTREFTQLDDIRRWHLASAGAVLLLAALLFAPAPPAPFRAEYDPKLYPAAAVEALRSAAGTARIFTKDTWGGYLIYRLYPEAKVFVDGRGDFYGGEFLSRYRNVMDVQYGWQEQLARYGVDTILLPTDAPLTGAVKESRRWHAVYDDGVAIVFRSGQPGQPAGEPVSAAAQAGGRNRDRAITKSQCDPSVTNQPKARSETTT